MLTLVIVPSTTSNLNLDVTRPVCHRRACGTAELVVNTAASLVNVPILQNLASVTRELSAALEVCLVSLL